MNSHAIYVHQIHPLQKQFRCLAGTIRFHIWVDCLLFIVVQRTSGFNNQTTFRQQERKFKDVWCGVPCLCYSFQIPPPAALHVIRGCDVVNGGMIVFVLFCFFLARLISLHGRQMIISESEKKKSTEETVQNKFQLKAIIKLSISSHS